MSSRALSALTVLTLTLLGLVTARAQWETPNRSFHNATAFPLEGRHLAVDCAACHVKGVFKGTPTTCFACHWIRRQDDRYQLKLGSQCEQCHRPTAWAPARWEHAAMTGTPLNAAHKTLGCDTCHQGGEFRAVSLTCVSCHQADYNRTQSPNHAAAGFPLACEACHRAADETFTQATFDHDASFPLVGEHRTVQCSACHQNNVYRGIPQDCASCHRDDYARAREPNHVAAGFPTTCETCHRPTDPSWSGAGAAFNHASFFQLVGVHATQPCNACHRNDQFRGIGRDCVGCHRDDYDRAQNPNHIASGFATTCEQCHRPDSTWRGASFNHNQFFQLLGVHATQPCAACHTNNQYKGTARDCYGCHRSAYDRTSSPSHASAGFPTTCEQCHRPTDATWRGSSFNHGQFFQLVGVHATRPCSACHTNNRYAGTPRDCYGCHRQNYERTSNPNHLGSGFPTSCESCHRPVDASWDQGTFNHRFPRVGDHNRPCSSCHLNPNNYREFSCTVCHERGETNEDHQGTAGYRYETAACYSCHPTGRE